MKTPGIRSRNKGFAAFATTLLFIAIVLLNMKNVMAQCPPVITPLPGPGVLITGGTVKFCAGDSVLLSTSPSGTIGYEWYINDILIPDSSRSIFTAKAAGSYKVKAPGCGSFSGNINITVNPLPTAYITSDPLPPVCSGTAMTFTLHTNATEFYWLPPVPPTAMYENPITLIMFNSSTIKAVTLNNMNPQCSKVANYWVQVNYPIFGGLIADNDTICSGEIPAPFVHAADPSGGNGTYVYRWLYSTVSEFGPWTVIPGAAGQSYTHPNPLTQTTWFARAAQSPPCAEGLSNVVVVIVNQNPAVTSPGTAALCSGETLNYFPTSNTPGTTFTWTSSVTSGSVTGNTPAGSGNISDVLTLAPGSSANAVVTYVITPVGPAPTFCNGTPHNLVVTIAPRPAVTNATLTETICAGGTTAGLTLTSNVPGTTFSWSAAVPPGISMNPSNGTGNIPAITIYSTNTNPVDVPVTITPTGPAPMNCTGIPATYIITVNPSPTVTNSPLSQAICSGQTSTEVVLTSNVAGTTFTWTATPNPAGIQGYVASGTSTIPAQTLINPTNENGTVTYHIIPSGNLGACPAAPRDYVITVGPVPAISSSLTGTICSQEVFNYTITSNVNNSGFSWSRPPVAGISPASSSGSNPMISETLTNSTTASIDVVYNLTPTGPTPLSCAGTTSQLILTVRPLPVVFAGTDQDIPYGTNASLSGSATGETLPLDYDWQPQGLINPPASNNQISVITANLYSNTEFTLTVTDGAGCHKSDALWVNLTGSALAANPTASPNPICEGSSAQLQANATGGSGSYFCTWSPASWLSDPSIANPLASPPVTTTYQVSVFDGYNTVISQVTVNVTPIPTAFTVGGGGHYCSGGSGVAVTLSNSNPGVEYTLYHGTNPVSGSATYGNNAPLTWPGMTAAGFYTVSAQQNGCPANMGGQAEVVIDPLPVPFTVTGGGSYPAGGAGVPVGLSASQPGVNYYLELQGYGIVAPSPVSGTGSAITFGNQTMAGTYIVRGIDQSQPTQCEALMSGNAVVSINPAPTIFFMTGGGEGCQGTSGVEVGLSGSEPGINYLLYESGVPTGLLVAGTGSAISFGPQLAGQYTCVALNPSNNISVNMTGVAVVVIHPLPLVFMITPVTPQCPGAEIRLNGSEAGVTYTLYRDGFNVASAAGTGAIGFLSFGQHWLPGTYTAVAVIDATGCNRNMAGSTLIQASPQTFDVSPAGILCAGEEIMLSGTQTGIMYQLRRQDTINVGSPLAGTGTGLNFGPQYVPGTYRVFAYNITSLCGTWMNHAAYLDTLPQAFTITPAGDTCGSTPIGLNGSEAGFTYQLYRDGIFPPVATALGTGGPITFGTFYTSGLYTVSALDDNLYCETPMNGSLLLNQRPIIYNVIPAGHICAGSALGLDNSEPGISYQLIRDATIAVGSPIAGTGSAISFGAMSMAGTYNIMAHNTLTGCSQQMGGSATLHALPLVFSMAPAGILCAGTAITLNGSEPGITYHLIRNNQVNNPQTLSGTGFALDFGPQYLAGNYTITAFDIYGCESPMNGVATIVPRPVPFAVTPQGSVCEPANVGLGSSETGVTYHLLRNGSPTLPQQTVAGTGFAISFGQQPQGTYTVRAVTDATGCDAMMSGQATVNPGPVAYAGADGQVCQNATFSPTASAFNYTTLQWTSSGDGWFSDPTILQPAYTPGVNDMASGSAMLFLRAFAGPACPGVYDEDTLLLSIHPLPQLEAGPDATICFNETFQANATAAHYQTLYWSTSGDGGFSDNSIANPVYSPGTFDIANGSVTLTLLASGTGGCAGNILSDELILTILPLPSANAGNDASICAGETYQVQGNGTGYASILWTTSGSGQFSNPFILNPVYTPSPADRAAGSVVLTLNLTGPGNCTGNTTSDNMVLNIFPMATANAGPDGATCASVTFQPAALATGYSAIMWHTNGDGSFNSTSVLNPFYTPGPNDIANGSVTLTLEAWGIGGCSIYSVTDALLLSVHPLPTGTAGPDGTICASATFAPMAGASNYSSVQWSTSGNGTFNNPNILNPIYTPGTGDIANGTVTLTLFVYGTAQCTSAFITDNLLLTIDPLPVVNAGPDATICASDTYTLPGIASGYSSLMWLTSGDGYFSNPGIPNPVYTPGPADIASGCITLTLRAYGSLTCNFSYTQDEMALCVQPLPLANAGADLLICANSFASLTGTAQHQGSVLWTTSGDGNFVNPTALVTSYLPGPGDISSGSATLSLTAYGSAQCSGQSQTDALLLTIQPLPTAFAGPPQQICANSSATLNASASGYSSLSWVSAGDGIFTDPASLSTGYTPGPSDIANGSVAVTLNAYGISPCNTASASSQTLITINPMPVTNAGPDQVICANSNATLNATASHYTSVVWSSAGGGIFTDPFALNTIYTPSATDIANGSATVTLTVYGSLQCTGNSTSDNLTLTIQPLPTAYAGPDVSICAGENLALSGNASNFAALVWTTSGSGTFSSNAIPDPVYYPSPQDISDGCIMLTLHAYGTGSCASVTATSALQLCFTTAPTVFAGTGTTICAGNTFALNDATAANYSSLQWTTGGTGYFSNPFMLNPVYIPSPADTAAGTVVLTLTAYGQFECLNTSVSSGLALGFHPLPVAGAGPDQVICANGQASLNATAWNAASVLWTTSGDGTFSNPASLVTNYIPGPNDITTASATLTITAYGSSQCSTASHSDALTLTIQPLPVVNAGPAASICASGSFQTQAIVSNTCAYLWTTSGDGFFSDPLAVGAIYYPGTGDILNGFVFLNLTGYGCGQCAGASASAQLYLTINPLPLANAGPDVTICAAQTQLTLSASAQHYSSVMWTTSGSGSFVNPALLQAVYQPSAADTAQGAITLTLTVHGSNQCTHETASDAMTLSFHPLPVADAGPDAAICSGLTHQLQGQARNHNAVQWSSTGDGSFSNPTVLNPVYTPGPSDITAGSVELILQAIGSQQCNLAFDADTLSLVIHPLPTAILSGNSVICEGEAAVLTVALSGTPPWSITYTDGTNALTISGILNTPYTWNVSPPVTSLYYLTAVSDNFCNGTLLGGTALVEVNPLPQAYLLSATNNGQYCQGGPGVEITLSGSQNGIHYKLFRGPQQIGPVRIGTGLPQPLSFGFVTLPGVYHAIGFDPVTFCEQAMDATVSVSILPLPDVTFTTDTACLGHPTNFSLSGSNLGEIAFCDWNFGDGSTAYYAGAVNPQHVYNAPGNYTVTLTATSINGCQRTVTKTVGVQQKPVAFFTWDYPNCQGIAVNFTNLSYTTLPDYIHKWVWDFGDGTPPQTINWPGNPNVPHLYAASGTYNVKLLVYTEHGCTDSIVKQLVITPQPVVDFAWNNNCQNLLTQFNDLTQGGNAVEWYWNFGDPASGSANQSFIPNPVHLYSQAGTYTVSLMVVSGQGCSAVSTKTVTINPQPVALFSADTPCLGSPTQFTDLSTSPGSAIQAWNWNFGDGSAHSPLQNPSHTYSAPGNYNVTLQVTDLNGCTAEITQTVSVWQLPYAQFAFSSPNCAGSPVSFTNLSTTPQGSLTTWQWDFGDGSTPQVITFPNNPNVSYIYNVPGNYTVTLTVTNSNGCQAFVSKVVPVTVNPIAHYTFPASNCAGASVPFTDASQANGGTAITTWNWNFGDPASGSSNNSTLQNPLHLFATAGDYNVRLIVTSATGCADTSIQQVAISALPAASFTADTACLGEPTHFTNTSIPNSGVLTTYLWNFGDGSPTSNNANPTHTYANAGTFQVTLTVGNSNGCTHSVTQPVKVSLLPVAVFTVSTQNCAGAEVFFDDLSTAAQGYITTWLWDFGDGTTTTVSFPDPPDVTHVYASPGSYIASLTVTTTLGCSHTTSLPVNVMASPIANFSSAFNCAGLATQFSDLSQTNGGGNLVAWAWDFGDPASGVYNTSTQQNPLHIFSAAGTFDVRLIVTNINNCVDTIIKPVEISPAPLAVFSADSACHGSPTQFTDLSQPNASAITEWLWDFGDGYASTLQNPAHTYLNWGTYNVTLTVTNSNGCQKDTLMAVFVKPLPSVAFAYEGNCAASPTQFTDLSATAAGSLSEWFWDFGDGSTDTLQHPSHAYAQGGSYVVTLTVTNSFGCATTLAQGVNIFNAPTASFNHYSVFCPAGQVTFQDLSTGNGAPVASRSWDFGNGFYSNAANPVYTYPIPDSCYNVTLVVANAYGCADTLSKPVCVKPKFDFTIAAEPGCAGIATSFAPVNLALGDTLMFVQWNFGDPASGPFNQSNLYYPSHVYQNPGLYFVKLRAWNSDNCLDSVYAEVNVLPGPVANFSWLDSAPHCDTTVTFANLTLSQGAIIDSLVWNFGDWSSLTQNKPVPPAVTHKFPAFGFYDVTLTAYVANGCNSTISKNVRVKCLTASFGADTLVCQNKPVVFNNSSGPIPNIVSYDWSFGDNNTHSSTTFEPSVSHVYASPGTYFVKLITTGVVNGLPVQDSITRIINVRPAPVANFSTDNLCLGDTVRFTDLSTAAGDTLSGWKWWFGDGKTSFVQHPGHVYLYDTAYEVQLAVTTQGGCMDTLQQEIRLNPRPEIYLWPASGLFCGETRPISFRDTIGGHSSYIWVWGDGDTTQGASASATHLYSPGTYTLSLTAFNNHNCQSSQTATITVKSSPQARAYADSYEAGITDPRFIFRDNSFESSSPNIRWDWFLDDTLFIGSSQVLPFDLADPLLPSSLADTGTYAVSLRVTNADGCTDTTAFFIHVFAELLFNAPNAFTPNWDGLNNTFKPYLRYIQPQNYLFQVYNRWGMLVFETTDPEARWDGSFNGQPCPQGVYIWIVQYRQMNGKPETQHGNVMLVR